MKKFYTNFFYLLICAVVFPVAVHGENHPNVLFIAMDDLNNWVHAYGYEQAVTPNIDRLARSGVKFTNAHTAGVYCLPSRAALFTGMHASTTGCYASQPFMYEHPDIETIQMSFQEKGYKTFGAGKLYHHGPGWLDLRGWDEYFTRSRQVIEHGYQMNGGYHMEDIPKPKPWPYSPLYRETDRKPGYFMDYGPIPDEKADQLVDAIRSDWAVQVLGREHNKPFFLGLGFYSPHYPNYSPQKYFDLYHLDDLEFPPYKADDAEDLPEISRAMIKNRMDSYRKVKELGIHKEYIRAYLAAISFADDMLGKVLDALDASPYRDNTIIVFWSDHGFHLGEKSIFGKHTLWERTSHVPLIFAGKSIPANTRIETSVSLIDVYPTLAELCNLDVSNELEGISLAPVLKNPSLARDRNVFMPHMERGSYAVMNMNWRYIHYNDGSEELYNVQSDPHEWHNLAEDEDYQSIILDMKQAAPAVFAPEATHQRKLKLVIEGDRFHWEKRD